MLYKLKDTAFQDGSAIQPLPVCPPNKTGTQASSYLIFIFTLSFFFNVRYNFPFSIR